MLPPRNHRLQPPEMLFSLRPFPPTLLTHPPTFLLSNSLSYSQLLLKLELKPVDPILAPPPSSDTVMTQAADSSLAMVIPEVTTQFGSLSEIEP